MDVGHIYMGLGESDPIAANLTLLCPVWYAKAELIHLPCGLCTGMHECWYVCRETLKVPFMQHMPGTFCHHFSEGWRREGEERSGKETADRWRSIRGGEGYKKPKEDEGETGQGKRRPKLSGGGWEKALPVGFHPLERRKSWLVSTEHAPSAPGPSIILSLTLSSTPTPPTLLPRLSSIFRKHWKRRPAKSGHSLISPSALFAKCNKWTGMYYGFGDQRGRPVNKHCAKTRKLGKWASLSPAARCMAFIYWVFPQPTNKML